MLKDVIFVDADVLQGPRVEELVASTTTSGSTNDGQLRLTIDD